MSRKLYLAFALLSALAGTHAHALGLGGLRLQSALDQPFLGEIDLIDAKPDELDAIKVQIAPQAEFSRAGTERYHHLTRLRFSPQVSARGNPVIRVSSREPMREPYMDFLVEVVWPKGRLVKQYTLLLDPPVTASRSAPPIEQPVVDARPARARAATSVPASATATPKAPPPAARPDKMAVPPSTPTQAQAQPMAPRTPPGAATSGGFPKRYGPIRPGTGLWRLARANAPAGATVSQTAMALYRNNPDAFIDGDINRLIAGRTLTLPHADELFAMSPAAANQEFQAAVRGEKVRRSPITEPGTPSAAPGEGESRLRIAGAAADTGRRGATPGTEAGAAGLERDVLLAREASESARQETVEMRGRIRDLESQLAEIQQLLKLRNEELARVQGGAGPAAVVAAASPAPGPEASATVVAQSPQGLPPDLKGAVGVLGGQPPDDGASGSAGPAGASRGQPAAVAADAPDAGPGPSGAARVGTASPDAGALPPAILPGPTAQPRPDAAPVAAVPPGQPPSAGLGTPGDVPVGGAAKVAGDGPAKTPVVAASGGDSTWRALLLPLAGVAGVTALGIAALSWLRSRRRIGRDSSVEFDSTDLSESVSTRPDHDLPTGPGASRAGTASAPTPASASPSPHSEEPGPLETPSSAFTTFGRAEPESDDADALSEADIYIAYGRYREAEDLLREEIRRTPARLDLKFKLAEAYYGAKNTAALRALMQEMQALGGDQVNPDQWQRLVGMAAGTHTEGDHGGVALPSLPSLPSLQAPASGVATATVSRPPAQTFGGRMGQTSNLLEESLDPGSAEVYTLDISDAQKPSADLALRGAAEAAPAAVLAVTGRATVTSIPLSTPISIDTPSRDLEPAFLDDRLFAPGQKVREVPRRAAAAPGGADAGFAGGVSDLDLNVGEPRPAEDLQLYSVLDSTPTTQVGQPSNEHSRVGLEISEVASASVYPRGQAEGAKTPGGSTGLPGLLSAAEDSASSDLLSSQWQMDSGLWDETATKLDLARAYIEMGDKDAAKGILEEVGGEGNEEQRAEAQELLRRVG